MCKGKKPRDEEDSLILRLSFFTRESGFVSGGAVDECEEDRGEDDPGKLIPVEEGEAEEHGFGAGVEGWEAQAYEGKQQEELSEAAAGLGLLVARGGHGSTILRTRVRRYGKVGTRWR